MLIHNKGRLTIRSYFKRWGWVGPLEDDPCWILEDMYPDDPWQYPNTRNVPECLNYTETQFTHDYVAHPECKGTLCKDKSHYTVPSPATTAVLKPCQCLLIKEVIDFNSQEHQEEIQCHWFRLAKEIGFYQYTPDEPWSSVGEDEQGTSGKGTPP